MSDRPTIRDARPGETDRLTEVAWTAKGHWGYPAAWMEAWRPALTLTAAFVEAHPVFVAVDADDRPLACAALVPDGADVQLEHVWVAPEAMGRGLGRALVAHAAAAARALGGRTLWIDSDPNAAAFYERLGAEPAGTVRADVCGTRRELPRLRLDLAASGGR